MIRASIILAIGTAIILVLANKAVGKAIDDAFDRAFGDVISLPKVIEPSIHGERQ